MIKKFKIHKYSDGNGIASIPDKYHTPAFIKFMTELREYVFIKETEVYLKEYIESLQQYTTFAQTFVRHNACVSFSEAMQTEVEKIAKAKSFDYEWIRCEFEGTSFEIRTKAKNKEYDCLILQLRTSLMETYLHQHEVIEFTSNHINAFSFEDMVISGCIAERLRNPEHDFTKLLNQKLQDWKDARANREGIIKEAEQLIFQEEQKLVTEIKRDFGTTFYDLRHITRKASIHRIWEHMGWLRAYQDMSIADEKLPEQIAITKAKLDKFILPHD